MRKPDAKEESNMPEIVGYCRVSTDGQTLDAQVAELKSAGAIKLFAEKKSGARSDRPQLRKALAALGEGDVLMVTRLDRLARSIPGAPVQPLHGAGDERMVIGHRLSLRSVAAIFTRFMSRIGSASGWCLRVPDSSTRLRRDSRSVPPIGGRI
jgi:hypothetical protein